MAWRKVVSRKLIAAASAGAALALVALAFGRWDRGLALVRVVRAEHWRDDASRAPRTQWNAEHPASAFRTFADSRLLRERFGPESARRVAPQLAKDPSIEHDPLQIVRRKPGLSFWVHFKEHEAKGFRVRTNDRGGREDEPFDPRQLDLRILVAGDSHSEGACENAESWANVLEVLLRTSTGLDARVDNASCAGHSPYHHLGVLERCLADGIRPDVFAVAVYAGNDLIEALQVHDHVTRTVRPRETYAHGPQIEKVVAVHPMAAAQLWYQHLYFRQNPTHVDTALDVVAAALDDARRVCEQHGVRFLPLWLPSAAEIEWDRHRDFARAVEVLDLSDEPRRAGERWREGLFARTSSFGWLDLAPVLADCPEGAFWRLDKHLSVAGQARVARAVFERLEADRAAAGGALAGAR